jgi:hypothetical protein
MAQCKALYKGCSEAPTRLTNASGSFDYALYCPCYDNSGQNTAANWGPAGSTTRSGSPPLIPPPDSLVFAFKCLGFLFTMQVVPEQTPR